MARGKSKGWKKSRRRKKALREAGKAQGVTAGKATRERRARRDHR